VKKKFPTKHSSTHYFLKIRQNVMGLVKRIKPEVATLQQEIIQSSHSGSSSEALKEKVEKLASLEAEATIGHLGCIEQTKAILTPEQTALLLSPTK
jgi:Spy/CpxP family protein refolding chaperone